MPSSDRRQAGYGAFSVGESQVPVLLNYIGNQWEHHRSSTFKEEFLNFLNRYGIDTMNDISGTEGGVTPFQGSGFGESQTQGVALGWYVSPFQGKNIQGQVLNINGSVRRTEMFKLILTGYIDMALSCAEYDKLEDRTFPLVPTLCVGMVLWTLCVRYDKTMLRYGFKP